MNEVIKALHARRSVRSFQKEQLREADLQEILDAGLWAPSGMGTQPVTLVAVQGGETIAQLRRMNAAVMGTDTDPFYGAPTVVVVLTDPARYTCVEDGALALGNLMLAAHALGVGSCWVHRAQQEFASEEGKCLLKKWGLPENLVGVGHCILGYPDGPLPDAKPRTGGRIVRA